MPIEIAVFGSGDSHLEVSGTYERREVNHILCGLGLASPMGLWGEGSTRYTYAGELARDINKDLEQSLAIQQHPAYFVTLGIWYVQHALQVCDHDTCT